MLYEFASDVAEFHKLQAPDRCARRARHAGCRRVSRRSADFRSRSIRRRLKASARHTRSCGEPRAARERYRNRRQRRALGGRHQGRQHLDQRALARSIGAQQAKNRTERAGEIQGIYGDQGFEAAGERFCLDRVERGARSRAFLLCGLQIARLNPRSRLLPSSNTQALAVGPATR